MHTHILQHGEYILRQSRKSDEADVQRVVFSVLREYGLIPEPQGVDQDLFDIDTHYAKGYFGVVIFEQKIIGTFGITYMANRIAEIRKMYILKMHRGKGLGSYILKLLTDKARNNGIKKLELETASVLTEAVQLYHKKGFTLENKNNMTVRCNRVFTKDISL